MKIILIHDDHITYTYNDSNIPPGWEGHKGVQLLDPLWHADSDRHTNFMTGGYTNNTDKRTFLNVPGLNSPPPLPHFSPSTTKHSTSQGHKTVPGKITQQGQMWTDIITV